MMNKKNKDDNSQNSQGMMVIGSQELQNRIN